MRIDRFVGVTVLLLCIGTAAYAGDGVVMKVAVTKTGEIFADGTRMELPELKVAFAKLSAEHGSVIYYRENPTGAEPHLNAMAVVQAIVEAKLSVSLSTKPDFSTVLMPDGTIKKRE